MLAVAVMIVMAAAVPVSADTTGSITITNATAGTTYTAYKIFSATANGNAVAYTTDETGKSVIEGDSNAPFTVDAKYNVERKETASDAEIIAWLSSHYKSFDINGKTNNEAASDGDYIISGLTLGYYYISAGNGSAISIDTYTGTDKSLAVKDTKGPNTPDKKITAEDGTNISEGISENNADVGSTETFSVTYNATNYANTVDADGNVTVTQIKNFYIKDTPKGLAIDKSTLVVKVKDSQLTTSDYTAAIDNDTGALTITIPWVDGNNKSIYTPEAPDNEKNPNYGNIPVTVTYDAKVTADAATAAATNEAHIFYNHDSSSDSDGEEVTTGTPPKTTTYTYKFQLKKVDENDNALAGAQFELCDSENNEVNLIKDGTTYRVAKTGETGTTTTIDMTTDTTVEILGLDNKEYTLKEIKAPAGYTLAKDTTIHATTSESSTNKLVRVDEASYGTIAGNNGNITIENKAGSSLPSTGGIGTTIFYVLGALLIIGAGVVLIARRRMNSNQ